MSHFVMQDMYQFALHIALSVAVDIPYTIVIKNSLYKPQAKDGETMS